MSIKDFQLTPDQLTQLVRLIKETKVTTNEIVNFLAAVGSEVLTRSINELKKEFKTWLDQKYKEFSP